MIDVQLGFNSHTENIMRIMPIMPIYKLNFYFVHKKSKKQIKEAGTTFVLLSWSRNRIVKFIKTHLHRSIKILQLFTPGRIQECLTQLQNILVFLTIHHLQAESRI